MEQKSLMRLSLLILVVLTMSCKPSDHIVANDFSKTDGEVIVGSKSPEIEAKFIRIEEVADDIIRVTAKRTPAIGKRQGH